MQKRRTTRFRNIGWKGSIKMAPLEEEQQGKERAEYGKQVLKELANQLSLNFGKGFSVDNLQNMRQLFLIYSIYETTSRISLSNEDDTLSAGLKKSLLPKSKSTSKDSSAQSKNNDISAAAIPNTNTGKFVLSWSHYLKLMRIENTEERKFYEIECAANNWSLKELQRQFDSASYERLKLSRDKEGI